VSTFTVEDAFLITGRGWVLAGDLVGEVASGNRLLVPAAELLITRVEAINRWGRHKTGLFIAQSFASRDELIEQQIIGSTAQIIVK
jgi:hypothetical protein